MHEIQVADLEVIEVANMEFRGVRRLNGFCIWFEALFVPFSAESLDTSPKCAPTHWNQELLLLDEEIALEDEEVLVVSLRIERNAYWRRHYVLYLKMFVTNGGEMVKKCENVYYHHRFPSKSGEK